MTKPEEFSKINLEDMIRRVVEPKVEQAIMKIREEVNKKSSTEAPGVDDGDLPGGGGSGGGAAVESIDMTGFSPEDVDALGRMISAESAGESAIGKAGVLAVILNRYRLIKSGKASPSSFNVHGKTKEQVTLRDILFAGGKGPGNQFSPYADGKFERTSSSSGKAALAEAIRAGGNDPEKFKKELIKSGLSEADADYVVRSVSFSNPGGRTSRPFNTRQVEVGRHVFQQSPNVKLTGPIGKVEAQVKEENKLLMEGGLLPSTRTITSYRGWRWGRMHRGVDYAGQGVDNQPISVIKPGKVVAAGFDDGGGGNIVVIEHNDGTISKYFHLKDGSTKVRVGQNISSGQVIGIVGNTGRSTGTHLHFEVWRGNKDLNDPHKLADDYFRFGGNVKPAEIQKLAKKDGKEGYINHEGKFVEQKWTDDQRKRVKSEKVESSDGHSRLTPITPENARNYADQIRKIKPGSGESLRIPGVGTFVAGRNLIGRPEEKYFHPDGTPMSAKEFLDKVRANVTRKKYGGLVYSNASRPTLPEEKYASYNDPAISTQLVIQPIIVQNVIPFQDSKQTIIFAPPVVNSTGKSKELMRS
jgi:murein DD-endopeptidase MepM/ murein hydrolase activator NlpD